MIQYTPGFLRELPRPIQAPDGWAPNEQILPALLQDFALRSDSALEFGVQHGYSTAALAHYFDRVTGVDTFAGDEHSGMGDPAETMAFAISNLRPFPNVTLAQSDFRVWIEAQPQDAHYDLVHVDLAHRFDDTYDAGLWAVAHSDCVLFHDTVSFREVASAMVQLAAEHHLTAFNYPVRFGLGILRHGR
jgi:hypothetical protein